MKNILVTIFIGVAIISCQEKAIKTNSKDGVKEFQNNFTSVIRKNITEYSTENDYEALYPFGVYAIGYSGIFFKHMYTKKVFDIAVARLENSKIYKTKIQNTTRCFIPNFEKANVLNKFAIPNFNDDKLQLIDSSTVKGDIFILKNEKGQFFNFRGIAAVKENAKLEKNIIVGKGFCKGAIVNYDAQKIIYWIIIW